MNERISELEALCWEDIPCVPYWDGMPGKHELYTTEKVFNKEKFAELIVRECILIIQLGITRDGHNTEKFLRSMKHIKEIKEHFGVEE
jgi:hypothetical protein